MHRSGVINVGFTELPAQHRLLVENDEKVYADERAQSMDEEGKRAEQKCFAQEHGNATDIHGIAYVAIKASDDESRWRIYWCQRATTGHGEIIDATCQHGGAE